MQITTHKIKNSTIVQVGDFGVGLTFLERELTELTALDRLLKSNNNQLYIIRGNHDKPSYFNGKSDYANIYFLKDYSVLDVNGKNILLVGGSISLDRTGRIEGNNYWKEEAFLFSEEKLNHALKDIDKLDIVVTHSAPSEFWPHTYANIVYTYARRDDNLLVDIAKDRADHSKLLKYLKQRDRLPKHWYYGHYHARNKATYEGIKYRTLNEMEIFQHF